MMEVFEASFLKHFQLLKKYKYLKFCRSGGGRTMCPSLLQEAVAASSSSEDFKEEKGGRRKHFKGFGAVWIIVLSLDWLLD